MFYQELCTLNVRKIQISIPGLPATKKLKYSNSLLLLAMLLKIEGQGLRNIHLADKDVCKRYFHSKLYLTKDI